MLHDNDIRRIPLALVVLVDKDSFVDLRLGWFRHAINTTTENQNRINRLTVVPGCLLLVGIPSVQLQESMSVGVHNTKV